MWPQAGPGMGAVPGCSMCRLDMGNSLLPDPLEPVTVSVHFRDIHVVGEPVHRRPVTRSDLDSLGHIRGDDQAP